MSSDFESKLREELEGHARALVSELEAVRAALRILDQKEAPRGVDQAAHLPPKGT